jgi:hypothetical protein
MPPKNEKSSLVNLVAVSVAILMALGGWDYLRNYFRSEISYEKLTNLRYHGEWSVGEYRECNSLNLREEDEKPEIVCMGSSSLDTSKIFKIKFTGGQIYSSEIPEGTEYFWLCRRDNADVTFSCDKKPDPKKQSESAPVSDVPHDLSKDDLENLRKRNECDQRFYDKKIYQVNGISAGEACKQNPDLRP